MVTEPRPEPAPRPAPEPAPGPAGRRDLVLDAVERQARSCAHLGSPIYAALLDEIAGDVRQGGPCAAVLEPVSDRPVHDAVPLRLLAATHLLALRGEAPGLAVRYPSCGGVWRGEALLQAVHEALAAHPGAVADAMRRNVQTNEIGRMVAIVAGSAEIARRTGLPLRMLEVGASAGLLAMWPDAFVDTGETATGDPASPLRFDPSWFEAPLPRLDAGLRVVDRAASDVSPIDVRTDAGRLLAESFVWPDQTARRGRLLAACALARRHGLHVEQADAGDWLAQRLAGSLPTGVATVVYHSIVWQYLPPATRDTMRTALAAAGATARSDAALAWLRMEPATPQHADLRLTTWSGRAEVDVADAVLAHVGYHGLPVRWLSA